MQISDSVLLETTINTSPEKVWEAWTNPILIKRWFGSDPNGTVLDATLDVRPGGYFEICFRDSDMTEHTCSGTYQDVEKCSKLTFSWQWKSEPGVESFVILTLEGEDPATKMQLEHRNLGTGSKHDYAKGWQATFSKLNQLLSTKPKL